MMICATRCRSEEVGVEDNEYANVRADRISRVEPKICRVQLAFCEAKVSTLVLLVTAVHNTAGL